MLLSLSLRGEDNDERTVQVIAPMAESPEAQDLPLDSYVASSPCHLDGYSYKAYTDCSINISKYQSKARGSMICKLVAD